MDAPLSGWRTLEFCRSNDEGHPSVAQGTLRVINDRREKEERLHFLGSHDELTGQLNRTRLTEELTRFLAQQLGPDGITANAIAPITTLTPRVAALRTEADIERIAALVPLKRLAEPEDHAQAMLFLASDAAAYINGVTLDVNGGRIMM